MAISSYIPVAMRLGSLIILTLLLSATAYANKNALSPWFLKSFLEAHSEEISQFASESPDCRLALSQYDNSRESVAIAEWTGCSYYCGSAGCRISVWSGYDGSWRELTDSNVQDYKIETQSNRFRLIVELHGSAEACGQSSETYCTKTAIISEGALTID